MASRTHNVKTWSVLEQAMAQLILNQAQLAAHHVIYEKESIRLQKASEERFQRIENLLLQHERMLKELPEAIRKKIGYQPK
jgi:uncharacterized protein (DUF1778 family)